MMLRALLVIGITLLVGTGVVYAGEDVNCILDVPQAPLTAAGLASPYFLHGEGCVEATTGSSAFVEATIINVTTGELSVYRPLVIDLGTTPLVAPILPVLPAGAVVGIGIGFNGDNLYLGDVNGSLAQGRCINGGPDSIFGQVAFCNSVGFYTAANKAVKNGLLQIPARGMALDGQICPSTWSYSIVDQDPIDNTDSLQRVTVDGYVIQDTAGNRALFPTSRVLANAGDFRVLNAFVYSALGCTPWKVPNLTDPGSVASSQHTDELQARFTLGQGNDTGKFFALTPFGDPMAQVDGQDNLGKLNALRLNVNQPRATQDTGSTKTYCAGMLEIGLPRVLLDQQFTIMGASPNTGAAANLFLFLASRFNAAFGADLLNCTELLGVANPVTLTVDGDGVVVDAAINLHPNRPPAVAPVRVIDPALVKQ